MAANEILKSAGGAAGNQRGCDPRIVTTLSISAPAKLNLFLAVIGRRVDGFHDLVSVAAPLEFGDTLQAEPESGFLLACDDPAVPCDDSNLVLKVAQAFRKA